MTRVPSSDIVEFMTSLPVSNDGEDCLNKANGEVIAYRGSRYNLGLGTASLYRRWLRLRSTSAGFVRV